MNDKAELTGVFWFLFSRKNFFSEEKKQKTFINFAVLGAWV
jgi:hypothetical protein